MKRSSVAPFLFFLLFAVQISFAQEPAVSEPSFKPPATLNLKALNLITISGKDSLVITVQTNRMLPIFDDKTPSLQETKNDNNAYILNLGSNSLYYQDLVDRSIKPQNYYSLPSYLKIRTTAGSIIKSSEIRSYLKNGTIKYHLLYLSDKDEDKDGKKDLVTSADISMNIIETQQGNLDLGYFRIDFPDLKDVKDAFLIIAFELTNNSVIKFALHHESKEGLNFNAPFDFANPDSFDLPLLTFSNISALIRGETIDLASLIPFSTYNWNVISIYPPYEQMSLSLSAFISFDWPSFIGLRNQQVSRESMEILTKLISTLYFGPLFGLHFDFGSFYAGYGIQINPTQPNYIDSGLVIAASIFDLFDRLLGK